MGRYIHGCNAVAESQGIVFQSRKLCNACTKLEELFGISDVYVQLWNANITSDRHICGSYAIVVADSGHLISINESVAG
jgi:hypothetical protein